MKLSKLFRGFRLTREQHKKDRVVIIGVSNSALKWPNAPPSKLIRRSKWVTNCSNLLNGTRTGKGFKAPFPIARVPRVFYLIEWCSKLFHLIGKKIEVNHSNDFLALGKKRNTTILRNEMRTKCSLIGAKIPHCCQGVSTECLCFRLVIKVNLFFKLKNTGLWVN